MLGSFHDEYCSGWTALFYAAEAGHSEIVRFLLAQDADPTLQGLDATSLQMMFPLKLAEQNGHAECAKLIKATLWKFPLCFKCRKQGHKVKECPGSTQEQ